MTGTPAWRQCVEKIRFNTYLAAAKAAYGLARNEGDCGLQVYQCPHCYGFHVGHASKQREAQQTTEGVNANP